MYKTRNFELYELVSEQVYKKYGEKAWGFFDPRALKVLDWLRDGIDKPITVNNWFWGGNFDERGFRANTDEIVLGKTIANILYCSPHIRGMAFDLNVEGMSVKEVKVWIEENKSDLPFNIRIEKDDGIERLHFDVIDMGVEIYYFAA